MSKFLRFLALLTCCLLLNGCDSTPKTPISEAPTAFHPVLKKLRDADFKTRLEGIQELGEMGESGAAAVPYLIERLKDNAVKVRIAAAWALGNMGHAAKAALPELKKATKRTYNEWKGPRDAAKSAITSIEKL